MRSPEAASVSPPPCAGGRIAIYSRNSENNTDKYPDIVADLPRLLRPGVRSVVLDCEAVAYDRVEKKILPFQVLLKSCQDPDLVGASAVAIVQPRANHHIL